MGMARGETIKTCEPNAFVTIGSYMVGTNYWNPRKCSGKQCLSIDNKTGQFTVTEANFTCAPEVASYPFIFTGSHFGVNSPGTNLPMPLRDVKCVTSSWNYAPTRTGSWDAAYDVWFSTGLFTANGFRGGAELMIWLDYMGDVPPAGHKVGPVTIDGRGWTLWEGNIGWNYIAYLADKPVDSVAGLDLNAFIKDDLARGYLDPDWFLAAVEVGNELRTGGVPFTSNAFSVEINKGCGKAGGKPTATPGKASANGVKP
jgi:cellulose 1,4-beta-cellobiosidase